MKTFIKSLIILAFNMNLLFTPVYSYAQVIATGGTISYLDALGSPLSSPVSGGYTVHTFKNSEPFTVTTGGNIEYLVVAGGGGGNGNAGGGAGGVLRNNALNYLVTVGSYPVTVGDGGAVGANGKNSVFKTFTAIGGGTALTSGGSGGGGTPTAEAPGKGTSGQGYAGGSGNSYYRLKTSGGGGGAGAVGVIHGGIGVQSSITGIATYYGGGGGGYRAAYQPQHRAALPGVGGAGGGGNYGKSGTPNTGGGGGGNGGTGGSGIVVLRYKSTVVALPIMLLSFNAKSLRDNTEKRYVRCDWSTASEINNDYFIIEKSQDGITFAQIGTTKGAGNSNTTLNYIFDDEHPYMGQSYYRLKQVDYDGKFSRSGIVPVYIGGLEIISIYPNPVGQEIKVKIAVEENTEVMIEVINMSGEQVLFSSELLNKGSTEISLGTGNMSQGDYILKATLPDKEQVQKMFVR